MCACFSKDGCQLYQKNKAIITSHIIKSNKQNQRKEDSVWAECH